MKSEYEILQYAEEHTSEEPALLKELNRETHVKMIYPRMLSGHLQGRLLSIISKMLQPENILEIGTYTGYSAICLAEGLQKNGVLHCIEINPEFEEIIRKYIDKSGFSEKIKLHIGDALELLPKMNETFDLVFIDADKEQYLDYYKLVFDKVKPGGIIVADNVLWDGKVMEEKSSDKETRGIKEFNDFIQNDERVENILLPLRDGLMMIRKK
ncbi:MAG TPA: O-methyltransferase [Bacteroidales bacterium]|nr:O-methyltransferase [Bacteroidales bacterium]HPS17074.1 O-methyltransferase [Bacteroidales bacterium]